MRMNPSEMSRPEIPGFEKLEKLIQLKQKHNEVYTNCLVLYARRMENESAYDDVFKAQYALLQGVRAEIDTATQELDADDGFVFFANMMKKYAEPDGLGLKLVEKMEKALEEQRERLGIENKD